MGQLSDPNWWWSYVVMTNYQEFSDSRKDERKAFNALVAMHHFPERLFWWKLEQTFGALDWSDNGRWGLFLARLRGDWQRAGIAKEMEILEVAANAIKHTYAVKTDAAKVKLHELTATGAAASYDVGDCFVDVLDRPAVLSILDAAKGFWGNHLSGYVGMSEADFRLIIKK